MHDNLIEKSFTPSDAAYVLVLVSYLGFILFFSAFFYLTTEDYEAVMAVRFIERGLLVGKSTGWPYTPLATYLYYLSSLFFGESILGFRLLTACLLVASIFPLYFTLRTFSSPFLSFVFTLFSFSVITFPHPRLEYYIEGALIIFAIFFATRYLQHNFRRDLYISALFTIAAFASRGYPNSAILVFLIPFALCLTRWLIESKVVLKKYLRYYRWLARSWFARTKIEVFRVSNLKPFGFLLLGLLSAGFLLNFLKRIVYERTLAEYADINDLTKFPSKGFKSTLSWILLCVVLGSYLALTLRRGAWIEFVKRLYPLVLPFVFFVLLFVTSGFVAGYDLENLLFFLFPIDIFVNQIELGRIGQSGPLIPIFLIVTATIIYMHLGQLLSSDRARVVFFLLLLLPCTFARFFPLYNMLYLISFQVAVLVSVILPGLITAFFGNGVSVKVQACVGIFFMIYSLGSNFFLMIRTQWWDFAKKNVVTVNSTAVRGIRIEKDVVTYFNMVDEILEGMGAKMQNVAFLSNRYLKYVPVIYGYRDVLAGQNLMGGLGRLSSYDDIVSISGKNSNNGLDWENMVYSWRAAAVETMKRTNTSIIIIGFHDSLTLERVTESSSDPFREYLNEHFVLAHIIEPDMKNFRRSSFPEGAVIFVRKAVAADRLGG